MKPVPFAQYLARQRKSDSTAAETAVWPPRAKTAAAPAPPPRPSPLLRQVEKESPDNAREMMGRLESGRLKAFEDGRESARGELEEERIRLRGTLKEEIAKARAQWVEEEAARFEAAHRAALDSFEQRCGQAVANILRPFLVQRMIVRVTDSLVENLEALFGARSQAVFEISGPADLLDALKARFGARNTRMEFNAGSSIDVRVCAGDTIIETQLGRWLEAVGAMTRGAGDE
jgi:hypothetical protein